MKNYQIIHLKPIRKWFLYTGALLIIGLILLLSSVLQFFSDKDFNALGVALGLCFVLACYSPFLKTKQEYYFSKKIQKIFETNDYISLSELSDITGTKKAAIKAKLAFLAKEGCLIHQPTGRMPKEFVVLNPKFGFSRSKNLNKIHLDLTRHSIIHTSARIQFVFGTLMLLLALNDWINYRNEIEDFSIFIPLLILVGALYLLMCMNTFFKFIRLERIKNSLETTTVNTIEELDMQLKSIKLHLLTF